ncbi:MAG: hypothetical protein EPN21_07335 [Methylococcaceae bacterium]|nr:MAG: hypothetical protein EPN21_07335 [Methylococcaceae bacterium]
MKISTILLAAVLVAFSAFQTGSAATPGCDIEHIKKMIRQARKDGTLVQFYETAPQHCPEYGGEGAAAKQGHDRLVSLVNDVRRESENRQGGGGGHH